MFHSSLVCSVLTLNYPYCLRFPNLLLYESKLTVKTLAKKALNLEGWEPITGLEKPRALYSFVKARQSLMKNRYPRWIIVELTTRCNSRCEYCTRLQLVKEKRLPPNRDLPFQLYIEFLDKFWQLNPQFSGQFIFGGLGEPTLYPDFDDALSPQSTGRRY